MAHTPPKAVYTVAGGLPGNDIFRLFEDLRGDIWITSIGVHGLTRWERATGKLHLEGGDVKLTDNGSTLSAGTVDYDLNTKDAEVHGSPAVMTQPVSPPPTPTPRPTPRPAKTPKRQPVKHPSPGPTRKP